MASLKEPSLANAARLADLTGDFAEAGLGTRADADRAAATARQQNRLVRTAEEMTVAAAHLTQQLSLPPATVPVPQELAIVPIEPLAGRRLRAAGLANRPELAAARLLVAEAVVDYNEAQFRLHRALGWPASEGPPVLARSGQAGLR